MKNHLSKIILAATIGLGSSTAAFASFDVYLNSNSATGGTIISAPIIAFPSTASYVANVGFPLSVETGMDGLIFAINDGNNANGQSNLGPTVVDLITKSQTLGLIESIQFREYYNGPNQPLKMNVIPYCTDFYGAPADCLFISSCSDTQGDISLTYTGVPTQNQGAYDCKVTTLKHL